MRSVSINKISYDELRKLIENTKYEEVKEVYVGNNYVIFVINGKVYIAIK